MTAYKTSTLGKSKLGISMLNSGLEWEQGQNKVGKSKRIEGIVISVQKSTEFPFWIQRKGYLIKILRLC